MSLTIRKLEMADNTKRFDCGDEPLNSYFNHFALANQEKHKFGVTYVAVSATGAISGYYTLATTAIVASEVSPPLDGAPKYPAIPSILLGRLAVALSIQRNGTGSELMLHALDTSMAVSEAVGARMLVTDAYPTAVEWYKKFGFVEINPQASLNPQKMIRMVLDLGIVKKAIAATTN